MVVYLFDRFWPIKSGFGVSGRGFILPHLPYRIDGGKSRWSWSIFCSFSRHVDGMAAMPYSSHHVKMFLLRSNILRVSLYSQDLFFMAILPTVSFLHAWTVTLITILNTVMVIYQASRMTIGLLVGGGYSLLTNQVPIPSWVPYTPRLSYHPKPKFMRTFPVLLPLAQQSLQSSC